MKIVFFGTPEFAAKTLEFLIQNNVQVVAVITKPDKPQGRSSTPVPTPVKTIAHQLIPNIPLFQPAIVSSPDFAETLSQYHADLFVVVAYGEILKQHVLDMPKKGCINVHASLLPKYRGAAPIQRSIINGETKTGITIMHMVRKMDAGDMIRQVEVPISPNDTFPDLEEKLCEAGKKALIEVINQFEKGTVNETKQDEANATYANKIELEDCEIRWSLPAQQIHNLIRGVTPNPGAWCWVDVRGQKKRLRILRSEVSEGKGSPGSIISYGKQGFIVAAGEKAIKILELQLEGKKVLSAEQFVTGSPVVFLE